MSSTMNEVKDFADGFDTFRIEPTTQKNLSFEVGMHVNVGKDFAGATAYMPVIKVSNLNQAIEEMKENNIWVYAADMDGADMYKTNLKGDIALVIGGEGTGVKQLTRKLCDGIISIPMYGKVNSLNASVSAGIVLYEAVRQRM